MRLIFLFAFFAGSLFVPTDLLRAQAKRHRSRRR